MFTNANLSFEAAPPIEVVLRFFLSGALFGVIAFIVAFFNFSELFNLYASSTVAFVHLLTLGVGINFLFGALFQMLPVIAGVSINNSQKVAMRVHYTLLVGTIFLISAFFTNSFTAYSFAFLFLSFSILYTAFVAIKELIKIKHSASSKGMLYTFISLVFLLVFATILILFKMGFALEFDFFNIRKLHFSFGLFGVFTLLILSVSFQVIEMFYVTPPYPKIYTKYSTLTIMTLLAITLIFPAISFISLKLLALLIIVYSTLTIKLLRARKRAVSDATIWFWYFSMGSALLFALSFIFNAPIVLTASFFTFFILATIFAMVLKIIPFLVWFQLNRQGYFDGPMMHEVIHPKTAKRLFFLFAAAALLTLVALITSYISILATLLFVTLFTYLFILIYNAWKKYLYTLKHGTRVDFPLNI